MRIIIKEGDKEIIVAEYPGAYALGMFAHELFRMLKDRNGPLSFMENKGPFKEVTKVVKEKVTQYD